MVATIIGCTQSGQGCGSDSTSPDTSESELTALLGGLPATEVIEPIDALPEDVDAVLFSPDPDAYRRWTREQPFVQRFERTRLYRELVTNPTISAINQIDQRVARAAALTGERRSLWQGPMAVGMQFREDEPPSFVAIRRVDPSEEAMVRFASTFAMMVERAGLEEGPSLDTDTVEGHPVYVLSRPGQPIVFALFANLTIVGDDASLVKRAVQRALEPDADIGGVEPLPRAWVTEPGVHLGLRWGGAPDREEERKTDQASLFVSLRPDAEAPMRLWRPPAAAARASEAPEGDAGGSARPDDATEGRPDDASETAVPEDASGAAQPDPSTAPPAAEARSLARYAPIDAAIVVHDATATPVAAWLRRLEASPREASDGEQTPSDAALAEAQQTRAWARTVVEELRPGMLLAVAGDAAVLEAQLAFPHRGRAGLEPVLVSLAKAWAVGQVARAETPDGDVIIGTGDGPALGLTDDAVIIGLTERQVRKALFAARGTAPSITDRPGWPEDDEGAVLLDFQRTAQLLTGFYGRALTDERGWADVQEDLRETFEALATAGTLAGPFTAQPDGIESTLRVVR